MKISLNTFLISDLHFGHNMQKFGVRPHGFEDLIISNWNKVVSKDDKVLVLGDLTLTNRVDTKKYCEALKGKKYLVLGNHDKHSESWYADCGFEVIEPVYKEIRLNDDNMLRVLFTHEPVLPLPQTITKDILTYHYFNIHGHLHGNNHRGVFTSDRHFDMSAEVIDYTPIPLSKLLQTMTEITLNS